MAFGRFDNYGYRFLAKLFGQWRVTNQRELDTKSIHILQYFIDKQIGSPYQCHKYMNKDVQIRISYKNVWVKMKMLHELGYIEENRIGGQVINGKHGAKYFRLSSYGIFYIFVRKLIILDYLELHPSIILNHQSFAVYCNLLFPHISITMLGKLKSDHLWFSVLKFIQNCCATIESAFIFISNQDYIVDPVEKIGGLLYVRENLGKIVVEELRNGKSFATFKKIDPDVPYENKRYELNEQMVLQNGSKILKITNKANKRYLCFIIQKGQKPKLQVYNHVYQKRAEPAFEVEVDQNYKLEVGRGFYVPLEIDELMGWYFEANEFLLLMNNHLIGLFINLLAIEYENVIDSKNRGYEDVFQDLILLRKDANFMGTFYNIQESVESHLDSFEKLRIS